MPTPALQRRVTNRWSGQDGFPRWSAGTRKIDAVDPAELIGLNEIVEGKPLTIPQTGAVIMPHPKFRLVATGNSRGAGDQSGLYQGVLRQNLAFLDRFRLLEVGYPEPEDEMKLLAAVVPSMPETVRASMIKVANQIRKVFIGGQDGGGMLSVTLSTRGLVRWASLVATFKQKRPQCLGLCPGQSFNLQGGTCRTRSHSSYRQGCFWR
jgi:hypothetical protein